MEIRLNDVSSFHARCLRSSQDCYRAFEALLASLRSPASRAEARRFLGAVRDHARAQAEPSPFVRFSRVPIHTASEPTTVLEFLEFPSTFSPEAWSFTFYEGLSRYPVDEFRGRTVVELGSGTGWITLALAVRCQPARIIGLDINPRAVLCGELNLYLNALDDQGEARLDDEGKSLLDRVEFAESDLLAWCRDRRMVLDRIIGCIPQVLSPEPETFRELAADSASDEELHALSNYCARQGYIEDQFGLGLMARALEESVQLLRSTGKVVFNVGGRPGKQVIERLFLRRGFAIENIWQTKVEQAEDTEIDALVDIENASSHRFEFFITTQADEPISAGTAKRYLQAGGRIFHALSVYEAYLPFPVQTQALLRTLAAAHDEDVRSALDLSFDEPNIAEERLSFLADLSEALERIDYFPYQDTAGSRELRDLLAAFLRTYFQFRVSAEQMLVSPSVPELLRNVIRFYRPRLALVERGLARGLGELGAHAPAILEAPRRVELCCRLLATLKPDLLITSLADFESRSSESFVRLVEACAKEGTTLLLDVSDSIDLSSAPQGNGVFQYLAENPLPGHVALLLGLVKNRVSADLQVCALISRHAGLRSDLLAAAELTYSRAPLLNQQYYARLLKDLLFFQRPDRIGPASADGDCSEALPLPRTDAAASARVHPALDDHHLPLDANTVRLDYGENCLPTPVALKSALLEGFVRQHVSVRETDPEPELRQLLQRRFGVAPSARGQWHFGNGVSALFYALLEACRSRNGRLLLPQGAYGHFEAAALLAGVPVQTVASQRENDFRVTDAELRAAVSAGEGEPWLFLNAPVVNPTGALYDDAAIARLHHAARACGVVTVIDAIFSGLEFAEVQGRPALGAWLADAHAPAVLLGGLSKEFAAGGLRFGYAYSERELFADALARARLEVPHGTLRYAVKRLLAKLAVGESDLVAALDRQRHTLRERAQRLGHALGAAGWEVIAPAGGLFMVARPTALLGRSLRMPDGTCASLHEQDFANDLWSATGLLLNGPRWTGLPGFCRFVLAVTDEAFEEALLRLDAFHQRIEPPLLTR